MKVKIGKYRSRLCCDIHRNHMDKKYGYGCSNWPTVADYSALDKTLESLENGIQSVYNVINVLVFDKLLKRSDRLVDIRIDPWDTWSMDDTLALIVLPMLKQLKETKHGAPYVYPEDVPAELRPTKEELLKYVDNFGETDSKWFERWDWVLNEMIYAFDSKVNMDDIYMRFDIKTERELMKEEEDRISNGFKLFGKYYQNLWD